MTVTVKEMRDVRRASLTDAGFTRNRVFLVWGDSINPIKTPEDAILASGVPDTLPRYGDKFPDDRLNLYAKKITAEETEGNDNYWKVSVEYEKGEIEGGIDPTDTAFQFTQSQETITLLQGLDSPDASRIFSAPGHSLGVDTSNAVIGWDGEKINGVSVPRGNLDFSLTQKYTDDDMDGSYLKQILSPGYFVNSAAWGGWAAGELRYNYAQGRRTTTGSIVVKNDVANQIAEIKIDGASYENTYLGKLYIRIVRYVPDDPTSSIVIEVYRKPIRPELIKGNDIGDIAEYKVLDTFILPENVGPDKEPTVFSPRNDSGLTGTIRISSSAFDTNDISIEFPFPWEITYYFSVQPNEETTTVGDITVTNKKGWYYPDVKYAKVEMTIDGTSQVVNKPRHVIIQKTFREKDFSFLKIDPSFLLLDTMGLEEWWTLL